MNIFCNNIIQQKYFRSFPFYSPIFNKFLYNYILIILLQTLNSLMFLSVSKFHKKDYSEEQSFFMAPQVGLEPRPFETSIHFRQNLAQFIVFRHSPCALPSSSTGRGRCSDTLCPLRGSQARWFCHRQKKQNKKGCISTLFILMDLQGLEPRTNRL